MDLSNSTEGSSTGQESPSLIADFLQSAVSGVFEPFGGQPSREVQKFRLQHPWLGFGSEAAGYTLPYVGWWKGATAIPKVAKGLETLDRTIENPILRGVAKNVSVMAPFEAGRTAIAVGSGNQDLSTMLESNAFNLGAEAIFGGAGGVLKSMAPVLHNVEGLVDVGKPAQMILRDIKNLDKSELSDIQINKLNQVQSALGRKVREDNGKGSLTDIKYGESENGPKIQFAHDMGGKSSDRAVNSLFQKGARFIRSSTDFGEETRWRAVLDNAGMDKETLEQFTQYPRWVPLAESTADKEFRNGAQLLKKHLIRIDENTYLKREGGDGLYVIAKRSSDKMPEGTVYERGEHKGELISDHETPKEGFVLFKTDSPDLFNISKGEWTRKSGHESMWRRDLEKQMEASQPFRRAVEPLLKVSGLHGTGKEKNALVDGLLGGLDKYVNPRQFQLGSSALGRAMLGGMEAAFDLAETQAKLLTFGARELQSDKSQLSQLIFGSMKETGESVDALAKALSDEGLHQVNRVLKSEIPMTNVAGMFSDGRIGQDAFNFLRKLDRVDREVDQKTLFPLQKLTGKMKYQRREGQYGINRMRRGDHRAIVYDENGNVIAVVGEKGHKATQTLADKMVKDAQEEGQNWSRSEVFAQGSGVDSSFDQLLKDQRHVANENIALADRLYRNNIKKARTSKTFKERHNVKGFVDDFTRDELSANFARNLKNKFTYAASLSSRHAIDQFADKLRLISGKHAFDVVTRRLADFEGQQGPIGQATNDAIDKVLSPVLGKNSATRIASTINKYYMRWSLGAWNIAYPAINALTFMQTSLPHVAFVQTAPDALLLKYYDPVVLRARNGVQAGAKVSGLKLSLQAARQLMDSSPEWRKMLNRAANEGTIDPKLIEDVVGQHAQEFTSFRGNLKSPKGWVKNIGLLADIGMEGGERLSRSHTFAMGYLMGKDFMGLKGEDLYQFTRKFTDLNMYRYATPDRASLFAGPVGSFFGLFKNWMLHYTMWMVENSGAAIKGIKAGDFKAAKPILWQIAGTTAVGGVGSWPFLALMNQFSEFISDKNVMQLVYDNQLLNGPGDGTRLSDAIYYGLPSLLGVSLASQAQMPFHAPLSDAEFMFTPVQLSRAKALYQAFGDSAGMFSATGQVNPLYSRKLALEWTRALAPKTVYHALQAQTARQINSSRSGQPLIKQVGTIERLAYAFALPSVNIDKQYAVAQNLWEDQDKRSSVIKSLGLQWKEAQDAGNYREVYEVLKTASMQGIDPSRVMRSAQSRMARERKDLLSSQFSPQGLWEYRNVLKGSGVLD